jgi:hypothetical protein
MLLIRPDKRQQLAVDAHSKCKRDGTCRTWEPDRLRRRQGVKKKRQRVVTIHWQRGNHRLDGPTFSTLARAKRPEGNSSLQVDARGTNADGAE